MTSSRFFDCLRPEQTILGLILADDDDDDEYLNAQKAMTWTEKSL